MTPPNTVAIATANTDGSDWTAIGQEEQQARALLLAAWRTHAEQIGADVSLLTAADVNVIVAPVGAAFRDDTRIAILPEGHGGHGDADHLRNGEAMGHEHHDNRGRMLCSGCGVPIFYCKVNDSYHYVDPTSPRRCGLAGTRI